MGLQFAPPEGAELDRELGRLRGNVLQQAKRLTKRRRIRVFTVTGLIGFAAIGSIAAGLSQNTVSAEPAGIRAEYLSDLATCMSDKHWTVTRNVESSSGEYPTSGNFTMDHVATDPQFSDDWEACIAQVEHRYGVTSLTK